ncbi:MAG TPA: metalloregulator ArsR/SmtB family transcription factor [Candidatus Baltobacteraceae bacterium]|nr:metalloregulator ArsR/SmtB family transcription factor [Candidatus Baltobacteraceae bacterium]
MVNNSNLDHVFSALADPTRRRIIEQLSRRTMTAGEIAKAFPISQPAISKHLRVLEDCGLLEREVVGRIHYCTLSPDAMEQAMQWVDRQRKYWNASLDRLEALLAKNSPKRK